MSVRIPLCFLLLGFFIFTFPLAVYAQIQKQLNWEELPPIPDEEGFAGMFTGVSNGALICMGGANFPDGMPWEGGQKVWYDNIYVLEKNASSWRLAKEKLPHPMGYGVSFTYNNKIILVGGSDATKHYAHVITATYEDGEIHFDSLASLPPDLPYKIQTLSKKQSPSFLIHVSPYLLAYDICRI